ncbi:MAG: hypothetical protein WAJ96_13535 [Candidatus Acidiferrum sp.]
MSQSVICSAINNTHLLYFYYTGDTAPGYRTIEPHTLGYLKTTGNLAVNGWLVGGTSESGTAPWWRDYLVSEMSQIAELTQSFAGPELGYVKGGGKKFSSVICDL